ncbi:hypothetical protein [Desulfosporosinus youngiae]|uniref:Uncharacterized protein n=1 Tax=Desulfosporosinus youngiae DSM 17734 TaxID=768710 RepID=H5Y2X5_9FIRM|nr:hypothetical protein [Desulfosporosinus youngiae]EHQ88532.1 hypothetical protein DesyoDRAFT_1374 [Desulfosporosinus youngiae DSM 17734]
MPNIHYDPERILNGFTEESLKDIAKRLKRRIRVKKSDVIEDILALPKGKPADIGKVWQEINRSLRRELEEFSLKGSEVFPPIEMPKEEQFKVSYMFTLSSNPEIRAAGEKLYCQAQEAEPEKDEYIRPEVMAGKLGELPRIGDERLIAEKNEIEQIEASEVIDSIVGEVRSSLEVPEVEMKQVKGAEDKPKMINSNTKDKVYSRRQGTTETFELQKKLKNLERKLRKTYSEGLSTREQLENLKGELTALRVQLHKEKEENENYRHQVQVLEAERIGKNREIELLKKKLEQLQYNDLLQIRIEQNAKLDLAAYYGRKALIFAEHDHDLDSRLNALGIIPIWAMEIDWNRPRRRMSTCQIVLYKMDSEKLKKLEEIREIARYLNVPCSELLDVVGGSDDQR